MFKHKYSNFEDGIIGDYKVSYMKSDDDKTLNYLMFDSLEKAKAKADELMAQKYTVLILKKNTNKNGSYEWEILPLANYANHKIDKYLILTLCVIIIILALSKFRPCK
jgi:hypothetical protein